MIPDHVKKIRDNDANEEANKGWLWAENKLKTTEPTIAYEYGVKAGYKLGFDSGFTHGKREGVKEVLEFLKRDELEIGLYRKRIYELAAEHFAELLGSEGKGKE